MTQRRPHTGVFVRGNRSSDGARTDQHPALESARINCGSQMIGYSLVVALSEILARDVFRLVPLFAKSGPEAFLALETGPVRTNPYPHDRSSIQIPGQ